MKCITMISLLMLFCGKISAQTDNGITSVEQMKNTTLMITELQNKVYQIELLKQKIAKNVWTNPQEKELTIIELDEAFNDVKIFIYKSLEQPCIEQNRLMEISNTIRPIDSKMAVKYAMMCEELQPKQK